MSDADADDEELAKEFERRNPHDCYVACVEIPIREIVAKLREIKEKPSVQA